MPQGGVLCDVLPDRAEQHEWIERNMTAVQDGLVILIVDDELALAEETAFGLEMAGLTTLCARSAAEAEVLLRGRPEIGVLVTDVRMPRGDGVALARFARSLRQDDTAIEVILMTGHATDLTGEDWTAVIAKPFQIDRLAGMIRSAMDAVLRKRAGAGDAPAAR